MDRTELLEFIKAEIASETKTDINDINENTSFHGLGIDSLSAVLILHNIENQFKIELNPILFWDHPTPGAFADYIIKEHSR